MANIDRILRVQQSYQLAKIGSLNKQMLIAQYAQCEQIAALQKQIQQSNAISRKILENQLKEFQYREKIKYYKALAYNMNEATTLIYDETNPAFQVFLSDLFLEPIISIIKESKDNLEDISDKSFCKEVENKISQIRASINNNREKYQKSEFHNLINSEINYEERKTNLIKFNIELIARNKDKQVALKINSKKNNYRGCKMILISILLFVCVIMIIAAIFDPNPKIDFFSRIIVITVFTLISIPLFFSIYKDTKRKKIYPTYLSSIELLKKEIGEKIMQNKKELKSHPYIKIKEVISLQYPNWQEKIELIDSFLPKEEKDDERDPLLIDAAKLVVTNQIVSVSMIQRKFSIGYNRANKIINELAELKIIDLPNKKVQLNNEYLLEMLFETLKEDI